MATTDTNSGSIEDEIRVLHSEQLITRDIYDDKERILEIVEAMGGIDSIISEYISESTDVSLSETQLKAMKNILTPNVQIPVPAAPTENVSKLKTFLSQKDVESSADSFYYTFYDSDKFMHCIFKAETVRKIERMLFSKCMPVTIGILRYIFIFNILHIPPLQIRNNFSLFWLITLNALGRYHWLTSIAIISSSICFVPYNLLWSLEMNRAAFSLVIWSFDFWMKMGYALLFILFDDIRDYHKERDFNLGVCLSGNIIIILVFIVLSSFDSLNVRRIYKLHFCVITALFQTLFWIQFTFLLPAEADYVMVIQAFNSEISCSQMIANAAGVLAIFVWKEAFYMYYYKDQCASIYISPHILWKEKRQ